VATTSENEKRYREACEVLPGGVNSSLRRCLPHLVFVRSKGAVITDADNKDYIDYHAAFGPNILGYNDSTVDAAVTRAIEEIGLIGVGTTEQEIELARKICRHVPSAEKVLFCNSGSEATYAAVRLARAMTGRKKIIKFQGAYHGWHDYLAMNVISPAEKLGERDPLSAGSLREAMEETLVSTFNDLDHVEDAVREHKNEVAAIILEPILHNIGCVLPQPGFLEGLREMTRREGIVLIFDEVITGFRHGLGGYQKICGVSPDLTTLGKSIANGYPMAALCGKRELMDRFRTHPDGTVFFAGTFNGHPLACAAALATIEVLERETTYPHLFALGERMRKGLSEIVSRVGVRATVAGFGSVFLTYFLEGPIRDYSDLLRNDSELFVNYRTRLIERGIFKLPMNLKRNHVTLSHTAEQIDRTLEACEDVLRRLARQPLAATSHSAS
jgi:glutamate-1-semialdehyde 2,1-aminomutase